MYLGVSNDNYVSKNKINYEGISSQRVGWNKSPHSYNLFSISQFYIMMEKDRMLITTSPCSYSHSNVSQKFNKEFKAVII